MMPYNDAEAIGYVIHPVNSRKLKVRELGSYDQDTNSYTSDEGYPIFEYVDTGEELSWDELNKMYSGEYLHEYLWNKIEWK